MKLNSDVGIFVTMNPGYAGRSNLPDNLKQLFRGVAMMKPDLSLITEVILLSQGFSTAEQLSGKIVLLFHMCDKQLSRQPHYDFGLRALKSVLVSAGNLKRARNQSSLSSAELDVEMDDAQKSESTEGEQEVLLQSACEMVAPKLVAEDVSIFNGWLKLVAC